MAFLLHLSKFHNYSLVVQIGIFLYGKVFSHTLLGENMTSIDKIIDALEFNFQGTDEVWGNYYPEIGSTQEEGVTFTYMQKELDYRVNLLLYTTDQGYQLQISLCAHGNFKEPKRKNTNNTSPGKKRYFARTRRRVRNMFSFPPKFRKSKFRPETQAGYESLKERIIRELSGLPTFIMEPHPEESPERRRELADWVSKNVLGDWGSAKVDDNYAHIEGIRFEFKKDADPIYIATLAGSVASYFHNHLRGRGILYLRQKQKRMV